MRLAGEYAPGDGFDGARMRVVVSEAPFAQDATAVAGAIKRSAELLAGTLDAAPSGGLFFPLALLARTAGKTRS